MPNQTKHEEEKTRVEDQPQELDLEQLERVVGGAEAADTSSSPPAETVTLHYNKIKWT